MLASTTESESRTMPAWLSIPIILVCLLAGGWMIHWYVISDPISHESRLLGEPAKLVNQAGGLPGVGPNRGRGGGGGPGGSGPGGLGAFRANMNSPVPFVRAQDDQKDRWEVRTEKAQMTASINTKGVVNVRVLYNNIRAYLPADVQTKLASTGMLLRPDGKARLDALKLPADQVQTLRQLTNANEMSITPAQKKSFQDAMYKYMHASVADRPAMEPGLYAMLDEVAQQSVAPTIQLDKEHAAEIDKILTPEVLSRATPTTAPAK